MWEGSLILNPQKIIARLPVKSMENFSVFQLIVVIFFIFIMLWDSGSLETVC